MFRENLQIAETAMRSVLLKIPLGNSCCMSELNTIADLEERLASKARKSELLDQLREKYLSYHVMYPAYAADNPQECGNTALQIIKAIKCCCDAQIAVCTEYSWFVFACILHSTNAFAELIRVEAIGGHPIKDDHWAVMIGRNETTNQPNTPIIGYPASWGEQTVICDPLEQQCFPASEITTRFYNYYFSADGKYEQDIFSFAKYQLLSYFSSDVFKQDPRFYNKSSSRTLFNQIIVCQMLLDLIAIFAYGADKETEKRKSLVQNMIGNILYRLNHDGACEFLKDPNFMFQLALLQQAADEQYLDAATSCCLLSACQQLMNIMQGDPVNIPANLSSQVLGNIQSSNSDVQARITAIQTFYSRLYFAPDFFSAPTLKTSAHSAPCTGFKTGFLMSPCNDPKLQSLQKRYKLTDTSQKSLEKALRQAAANNRIEDVDYLISKVQNIDAADSNPTSQKTALHYAAIRAYKDIWISLTNAGAKTDIADAAGKTAAYYAPANFLKDHAPRT